MSNDKSLESSSLRSLRLWPGVVIVTAQWLARFGLPVVRTGALAASWRAAAGLALVVWWLFFSRAAGSIASAPSC